MQDPTFNLLGLQATGDASEQGLAKAVQAFRDTKQYRAANPKVFEIKFNSTNKWQLSIHEQEAGGPLAVVLKGAPERVLLKCKYMMVNGEKKELTPELEAQYTTSYEELGGLGERVLGFAYSELDASKYDKNFKFDSKPAPNFPVDDLTFVGLLSLIDPPREGVPEAVAKCKRARIKVFMVTGESTLSSLSEI
jgi:sodium/potassium-transporting ATPase subunit alpha